jgi:protein-tyrosine phosphatase
MKILMVCLGNICRSPMAEGILRKKSLEVGKNWIIDSAGTSNYHIGEAPDSRATQKSAKYDVDISNLRGRQFSKSDFDKFDLILAMDESNYSDILRMARNEFDQEKVKMILNFTHPGKNLAVPDPYYGGDAGFEEVYKLLNDACDKIIEDFG